MRILVIEDDPALGAQVIEALGRAGYATDLARDGEEGGFLGETEPYDAVVLDLGLPEVDGLTVLRRWRKAGVAMPVIVLTARAHWHEKVEGIDAGADDYLTKPFRMEELLARVRALIRRAHGHASADLACGPVRIDTRTARVSLDGNPVTLTAHEYRVLVYLMMKQGQIVTRTELTEHIYAQDFDRDSNTIEVFVARLRKKLGDGLIATVRGLGYRIQPPPEARSAEGLP
ncbi:MAG: response regulator transcription factor [Rhodospirillaceae bacterium]